MGVCEAAAQRRHQASTRCWTSTCAAWATPEALCWRKEMNRMGRMSESGKLPPDFVTRILGKSGASPLQTQQTVQTQKPRGESALRIAAAPCSNDEEEDETAGSTDDASSGSTTGPLPLPLSGAISASPGTTPTTAGQEVDLTKSARFPSSTAAAAVAHQAPPVPPPAHPGAIAKHSTRSTRAGQTARSRASRHRRSSASRGARCCRRRLW